MSYKDLQDIRRKYSVSNNDSSSTVSPYKSVRFDETVHSETISPSIGLSAIQQSILVNKPRVNVGSDVKCDNAVESAVFSELKDEFDIEPEADLTGEDFELEAEGPEYDVFRMVPPGK